MRNFFVISFVALTAINGRLVSGTDPQAHPQWVHSKDGGVPLSELQDVNPDVDGVQLSEAGQHHLQLLSEMAILPSSDNPMPVGFEARINRYLSPTYNSRTVHAVSGKFYFLGMEVSKSGFILLFEADGSFYSRFMTRFRPNAFNASATRPNAWDEGAYRSALINADEESDEFEVRLFHRLTVHGTRYATEFDDFVTPVTITPDFSLLSQNILEANGPKVFETTTVLVNENLDVVFSETFTRRIELWGSVSGLVSDIEGSSVRGDTNDEPLIVALEYDHVSLPEPISVLSQVDGTFTFPQNLPAGGILSAVKRSREMSFLENFREAPPFATMTVDESGVFNLDLNDDVTPDETFPYEEEFLLGNTTLWKQFTDARAFDRQMRRRVGFLPDPVFLHFWRDGFEAQYDHTIVRPRLQPGVVSPGGFYLNADGINTIVAVGGNNLFADVATCFKVAGKEFGRYALFSRTGRRDLGDLLSADPAFVDAFANLFVVFTSAYLNFDTFGDLTTGRGIRRGVPETFVYQLQTGTFCSLDPTVPCSRDNTQFVAEDGVQSHAQEGLVISGLVLDLIDLSETESRQEAMETVRDLLFIYVHFHLDEEIGRFTGESITFLADLSNLFGMGLSDVLFSVARVRDFIQTPFKRGDANLDGEVDLGDAVTTLNWLFVGGICPCHDAVDSNDDGEINLTDAVFTLNFLFLGGRSLPEPLECGFDPTNDALGCRQQPIGCLAP